MLIQSLSSRRRQSVGQSVSRWGDGAMGRLGGEGGLWVEGHRPLALAFML